MLELRIDILSIHSIPYEQAASAGSGEDVCDRELPVILGSLSGVKVGVSAIVLTGDLQGEVRTAAGARSRRLLGEALADELATVAARGAIPPPEETGVILAGDFYAEARAGGRGVSGIVQPVWEAFGEKFKWVVGVSGNHDALRSPGEMAQFRASDRMELLDGTFVDVDGLRIGGVGGIIGRPTKLNRKTQDDYMRSVRTVLTAGPDILVTHMGPDIPDTNLKGSTPYRLLLEQSIRTTAVFGHVHWPEPTARLANGTRLLNVAGRAVVLVVM